MTSNESVIAAASRWAGSSMALATVISTWGSAPSPRGSHLLVHEDGRFEGAISGGCVEADILALAMEVMAGRRFERRRYGITEVDAWEVGLPCGGEIEVMVQPVSVEGFDPNLFKVIAAASAAGTTLAVSTDLISGRSGLDLVSGELFVNLYLPPRRLLIVGAVQIAQVLAGLARELGMATVLIDPRERFLTCERFPNVQLDDRWPDEAIAALRPDASTAIVTLSHDPKIDDPALIAAIRSGAGYVAALGSRRSHLARQRRMAQSGLSSAQFNQIEGPAGLDIGAVGPAEIALSIAAGMIKALRQGRGRDPLMCAVR